MLIFPYNNNESRRTGPYAEYRIAHGSHKVKSDMYVEYLKSMTKYFPAFNLEMDVLAMLLHSFSCHLHEGITRFVDDVPAQ